VVDDNRDAAESLAMLLKLRVAWAVHVRAWAFWPPAASQERISLGEPASILTL
jgi:hypothetical protein